MSWSLAIRVVPNAKKNDILGAHGSAIRVKIAAPALDGKANAALLAFLAEQIGIPKNQVQLLAGEKSRDKVVGGPGAQPTLPASFRVPEASKKPV